MYIPCLAGELDEIQPINYRKSNDGSLKVNVTICSSVLLKQTCKLTVFFKFVFRFAVTLQATTSENVISFGKGFDQGFYSDLLSCIVLKCTTRFPPALFSPFSIYNFAPSHSVRLLYTYLNQFFEYKYKKI